MGILLRDIEAQHRKTCDTDMSGCGELNSVNHFLQAAPCVFTLQVRLGGWVVVGVSWGGCWVTAVRPTPGGGGGRPHVRPPGCVV